MKKTLISLTAAAALAIGFSATAKADGIGFGIGFGPGGVSHFGVSVSDGGYYGPGYYDAGYGYGGDCGYEWVTGWHWHHHHKVFGPYKVMTCGDY
ncbi:MAG: hypothetical protein KGO53_04840 [Alphaproteobacteria bacterium]|nr:hypothetical protein [Alphaproteobacteria bacterium]